METIDLTKCKAFTDYHKIIPTVPNKVSLLVSAFVQLHPDAPSDDVNSAGGRIAQLWAMVHKDTGYLLRLIWITSADNPCGSHLNYIQGIIRKGSKNLPKEDKSNDHAGMDVIK